MRIDATMAPGAGGMARDLIQDRAVSFLFSSAFGPLELRSCRDAASTCPLRAEGCVDDARSVRVRCLAVSQQDFAECWLRDAASHADDMSALRRLAFDDTRMVPWLSDHQVIERIAKRVARRELCLVVASRISVPELDAPPLPAPVPAPAATPASLRPRAEEPAPIEPVAELVDNIDQALQAEALIEAARTGVPFCEECAKARGEQAAGVAGAV